jgi:DNA-directed RNA polymerase specialized sigma24 family protein
MAQALERVVFGTLPQLLTAYASRLSYEHDVTHSEIAGRLGLPDGTVKVRLHRLRARLHQELSR